MPPEPGSPEAWLQFAVADLTLARQESVSGVMLELLCFHAQQAAEKSIKAVLVLRKVTFPKTHDLKLLIELLPNDIIRPQVLLDAVILSDYATVYRYPGMAEQISHDEYHHLVSLAEAVVAWAEAIIADDGH